MTLEKLIKDNNKALKEHSTIRREVLTSAISRVKNAAIDKGCRQDVPEELVNEVLLKELKTYQEMIDTCPADRIATIEEYSEKRDILKEYCPSILTDEADIKELITQILKDNGLISSEDAPLNKGAVMKLVMPQLKGKVDMKVANKVLGEMLK